MILVVAIWLALTVAAFGLGCGLCRDAKRGDEMAEAARRASWDHQ